MKFSSNALSAVSAVLAGPSRERDEQEKRYDEIVESCVEKPEGHSQKEPPEDFIKRGGKRLYAVTTFAASARYGGTRTPVICDSFERAKQIVEENHGDIYETSYQLACIEAVACNWLYYHLTETYWYRWEGSHREGRYVPIETPEAFKDSYGFSIG